MKKFAILMIFLLLMPLAIAGEALNKKPTVSLTAPYNPTKTPIVRSNEVTFQWVYKDADNDPQKEFYIEYDEDQRFGSPIGISGIGSANSHKVKIIGEDGIYYTKIKVKDIYQWGDWSEVIKFYIDTSKKECSDETPFYECSIKNKPMYCDGGVLIADCSLCGCDKNEVCVAGVCKKQRCDDGTEYGLCSRTKPKFCNYGNLLDLCSVCGCPEDKECQINGKCKEIELEEIEEVKPEIKENKFKSFLRKISDFFKNLLPIKKLK